jgi:Heterokaryon incompatibility protein (HET)
VEHWARLTIGNQTFKQIFNHYDDSQHLEQSALNGFHLCTLFWRNFDPKMNLRFSRLAERNELLSEIWNGRQVQITAYDKGSSGCVLSPSLSILDSRSIRGEPTPLGPSAYFRSHQKGDPPTSLSSTDVSTTSLAATNLPKEWIAECTKLHPKCAQGKSSRLPTRLVDVLCLSKVGKVRIVETHSLSSDIQYVELSYCWGLKPTFRLTTSTWEASKSIVAIENLPRTIQDAINFTRNINLEWLWIDSLCIIQDSREDWSRESLTMREVYQGFFIKIAALGVSSSEEGLFALRDPLLYSPCFLFQTKQGENIYGGQDSRFACVLDDAWPLHQRGWVTQERILPSKTLKFGPYLIWECRGKIIYEYNVNAGIRSMGGFGMIGQFYDFVTSGRMHSTPTERDEAILRIWDELVVSYSQAALTAMTNRLVAISEIIVAIPKRTGWTNLAGLWEPFLWKQLLWRKSLDPSREPTRLLPSWSWIAINGGVYWARDERPSRGFFLNSVAHVKRIDNVHMDENGTSDARMALQVCCMPARIGTPYSLQKRASKGPEGKTSYGSGRLAFSWAGNLPT